MITTIILLLLILTIITIITIIILLFVQIFNKEHFESDFETSEFVSDENYEGGEIYDNKNMISNNYENVKPITNGNNTAIISDDDFSDVVIYHNDEYPYPPNGKNGVVKCNDNCDGHCVEFGITGKTFCFPNK